MAYTADLNIIDGYSHDVPNLSPGRDDGAWTFMFGTCHKQKITFYDKDSLPQALVHYNLMPGLWPL